MSKGGKCWPKSNNSKAARNRVSKEIGALMAQKKTRGSRGQKGRDATNGRRIAALDKHIAQIEQQREALMLQLPNLPHASVAHRQIGGGQCRETDLGRKGQI